MQKRSPMIKKALLFVAGWKVFSLLGAYVATFILPLDPTFTLPYRYRFVFTHPYSPESKFPYLLWIWGNFDGFYYTSIAQRGYYSNEEPFFPFYPLIVNLVSSIFSLPSLVSALLVSHLALIVSLIIIGKILLLDGKGSLVSFLWLIVLLFPSSFFYGAAYNDSLFLLWASLTIYFARRRFWGIASMGGALATLTRLNGLVLLFFILCEYVVERARLSDTSWEFRRLMRETKKIFSHYPQIIKDKIYMVALIPLAFLGYLFYIEVVRGDWNLVFSSMKMWNQDKVTFPLQVFWRYIKIVVLYPTFKLNYWVAFFELFSVLTYVFFIVYSYKKIRVSYWIFFVVSILIPSLTGTFQGMPRYGLHLYPFFLSVALFLSQKRFFTKFIYFTVSISLFLFAIMFFTRGYFVA